MGSHMRSKTMMNLMQLSGSGKERPKKTILVKVSSNEALNSNKSEMASRMMDEDMVLDRGRTTLDKEKSKE